jgi:hypothetical protein
MGSRKRRSGRVGGETLLIRIGGMREVAVLPRFLHCAPRERRVPVGMTRLESGVSSAEIIGVYGRQVRRRGTGLKAGHYKEEGSNGAISVSRRRAEGQKPAGVLGCGVLARRGVDAPPNGVGFGLCSGGVVWWMRRKFRGNDTPGADSSNCLSDIGDCRHR